MFDVNFSVFLLSILPWFMRTDIMVAWKNTIANVMDQVNDDLVEFVTATTDVTNITGQKIYLEKYLNDEYDNVLRRIYIQNVEKPGYFFLRNKVEQRPPVILFNKSEGEPPVYLNNKIEIYGEFEYIIFIPVVIAYDEDVLRKQVNVYNPAGRRYDIQTF